MGVKNEIMLNLYETMFKIRKFEEKASELFADSLIPGFVHLYLGEEAIATGVCANLSKIDYITSTHRGHGHVIAKGAEIDVMMAELFGKKTGYCKGKGGSMHIADVEKGILGANGIVGGGQPIATGAAFACKMMKTGGVAVCFFGDGASNRGTFHESINLASAWGLPVLYVIENNCYGISCCIDNACNVEDLSVRAEGYGIPGITIDGNDVLSVYKTSGELIEKIRIGQGPALLECKTWRHHGHFEGDPGDYKPEEDQEKWLAKDPLPSFRTYLLKDKKIAQGEIEAIEEKVKTLIEKAVEFATSSPDPEPESILENVYAQ